MINRKGNKMKFKIKEKVIYFADDTEEYFFGVISDIDYELQKLDNSLRTIEVTFKKQKIWFSENQLIKINY
jgi:hypothetical protein